MIEPFVRGGQGARLSKTAEPIKMPFGGHTAVAQRSIHYTGTGVHIDVNQ